MTSYCQVGRGVKLTLTEREVNVDVFCSAIGGGYGGIVFTPTRSAITVTRPSDAISVAKFHLFNFPDFFGPESYVLRTGEPPLEGFRGCGRAVLKADGWVITIAATDRTRDLEEALKGQGGYAITHMGQVVREDGTKFSSEDLDDLLACLHYFLSFALGRWVGLALPVGFNTEGNRVFEQWGLPRTAGGPWNGSCSWFDEHHGELLSLVFPGFLARWKSPLWHQPLTHAIYWYCGACDRGVGIGVDAGLILAQTALELLAWTHCVRDRKMAPPKKFERGGLDAAAKLRLLAGSLGIPVEIPANLSALREGARRKPADGMDAITGIRNSLVHPNAQPPPTGGMHYYEANNLSLWYIDLVLLRLCEHNGMYANRLVPNRFVGAVELVPWAKKEQFGNPDG